MKINEIFYSIQGEGIWSGMRNVFIRTAGCNLRCRYCDTAYAYEEGKEFGINQIIVTIQQFSCKKVCLTGGEPLLQKDSIELIKKLISKNYEVLIETNGSQNINELCKIDNLTISLDIKCPSSEMSEKNNIDNINKLRKKDQIKFVISDKEDYNFAKNVLNKHSPNCIIYFQAVHNSDYKKLAEWILEDALNVRFGLQIHKFIWGNVKGK